MDGLSQRVKTCPDCGENVEQMAGLCRSCGYIFSVKGIPGITTAQLAYRGMDQHGWLVNLADCFPRRAGNG